jgi:hypothetical protein
MNHDLSFYLDENINNFRMYLESPFDSVPDENPYSLVENRNDSFFIEKNMRISENKDEDYNFYFFKNQLNIGSKQYQNTEILNSPCKTETVVCTDSENSFSIFSFSSSSDFQTAVKKEKKEKSFLKDEEARKRLKVHFFKKILKRFNNKIEKPHQLKRLPQKFIKNLAIEENKKWNNQTLYEVITNEDYSDYNTGINKKNIQYLRDSGKHIKLITFFNTKLKLLMQNYFNSSSFESDLHSISRGNLKFQEILRSIARGDKKRKIYSYTEYFEKTSSKKKKLN